MTTLYELRPYQAKALEAVAAELTGPDAASDRCQVISACGTGKTLMSQRIGDRLAPGAADIVVFTAPSISLIDQNMTAWTDQMAGGLPFDTLAVCSDPTVTSAADLRAEAGGLKPAEALAALGPAATTDPVVVKDRVAQRTGRLAIFVTHVSLHVVADALESCGDQAAVLLVDEAHKTAGVAQSRATKSGRPPLGPLVLDQFPAARRVFFTATPRIYAGGNASDNQDFVACMTDGGPYGRVVFNYRFSEAVEHGWLVPFRLLVSVCSDPSLDTVFTDDPDGLVTYQGVTAPARQVAAHLAIEQAIAASGSRRILTFHSTVKAAEAFAEAHPAVAAVTAPGDTYRCEAMSGSTPSADRRIQLDRLAAGVDPDGNPVDRSMMSNAKVLTEGVDVPAIDMVAFCDPKQSVVDITQAIGRAMRPADGKTEGAVVIPVVVPSDADIDTLLDSTGWRQVRDVVAALQSVDEDLAARFRDARTVSRTEPEGQLPASIEVIGNLPPDAHHQIVAKVIADSGPTWDATYGEVAAWYAEHGRAPALCKAASSVEYSLASWVSWQRASYKTGDLSTARIERLEVIADWSWSQFEDDWTATCTEVAAWYAKHGRSPRGGRAVSSAERALGRWIGYQRNRYRTGGLSAARMKRLEAIPGWSWDKHDDDWDLACTEVAAWYAEHGSAPRASRAAPSAERKLGQWVSTQRAAYKSDILDDIRAERLEAITGWSWDKHDDDWNRACTEVAAWYAEYGRRPSSAAAGQAEKRLGSWASRQRASYRTGDIDPARAEMLESIPGWTWTSR
jgi:superfamily II DNA or RNA helicase